MKYRDVFGKLQELWLECPAEGRWENTFLLTARTAIAADNSQMLVLKPKASENREDHSSLLTLENSPASFT